MSEPDIRAELSKVEAEPLLPIEKKLIGWSLGIGIASLIILVIINRLFPPPLSNAARYAARSGDLLPALFDNMKEPA